MEVIILVERKEYLERLIQWKDEQVIKVVTGIRRCGKSTLLLQYQTWHKANGISKEQIVSIKLPLSFREFLEITVMDADRGLAEYIRAGGLPYIAVMDRTPEKVETYLEGIYNTVIVKDI